jgi:hypothetical protein
MSDEEFLNDLLGIEKAYKEFDGTTKKITQ